jgi:hypothetical protein
MSSAAKVKQEPKEERIAGKRTQREASVESKKKKDPDPPASKQARKEKDADVHADAEKAKEKVQQFEFYLNKLLTSGESPMLIQRSFDDPTEEKIEVHPKTFFDIGNTMNRKIPNLSVIKDKKIVQSTIEAMRSTRDAFCNADIDVDVHNFDFTATQFPKVHFIFFNLMKFIDHFQNGKEILAAGDFFCFFFIAFSNYIQYSPCFVSFSPKNFVRSGYFVSAANFFKKVVSTRSRVDNQADLHNQRVVRQIFETVCKCFQFYYNSFSIDSWNTDAKMYPLDCRAVRTIAKFPLTSNPMKNLVAAAAHFYCPTMAFFLGDDNEALSGFYKCVNEVVIKPKEPFHLIDSEILIAQMIQMLSVINCYSHKNTEYQVCQGILRWISNVSQLKHPAGFTDGSERILTLVIESIKFRGSEASPINVHLVMGLVQYYHATRAHAATQKKTFHNDQKLEARSPIHREIEAILTQWMNLHIDKIGCEDQDVISCMLFSWEGLTVVKMTITECILHLSFVWSLRLMQDFIPKKVFDKLEEDFRKKGTDKILCMDNIFPFAMIFNDRISKWPTRDLVHFLTRLVERRPFSVTGRVVIRNLLHYLEQIPSERLGDQEYVANFKHMLPAFGRFTGYECQGIFLKASADLFVRCTNIVNKIYLEAGLNMHFYRCVRDGYYSCLTRNMLTTQKDFYKTLMPDLKEQLKRADVQDPTDDQAFPEVLQHRVVAYLTWICAILSFPPAKIYNVTPECISADTYGILPTLQKISAVAAACGKEKMQKGIMLCMSRALAIQSQKKVYSNSIEGRCIAEAFLITHTTMGSVHHNGLERVLTTSMMKKRKEWKDANGNTAVPEGFVTCAICHDLHYCQCETTDENTHADGCETNPYRNLLTVTSCGHQFHTMCYVRFIHARIKSEIENGIVAKNIDLFTGPASFSCPTCRRSTKKQYEDTKCASFETLMTKPLNSINRTPKDIRLADLV